VDVDKQRNEAIVGTRGRNLALDHKQMSSEVILIKAKMIQVMVTSHLQSVIDGLVALSQADCGPH
jgi:hypothetical protein